MDGGITRRGIGCGAAVLDERQRRLVMGRRASSATAGSRSSLSAAGVSAVMVFKGVAELDAGEDPVDPGGGLRRTAGAGSPSIFDAQVQISARAQLGNTLAWAARRTARGVRDFAEIMYATSWGPTEESHTAACSAVSGTVSQYEWQSESAVRVTYSARSN